MKEHENSLKPEAIDPLTERSSNQLPQEERRLVQGLYTLSQEYARENESSLERIWQRFVQSQEHSALPQERQQEKPEGKLLFMEGKAMQENDFRWETEVATLRSQPTRRSRRSFWRTLGISVAAAVVLPTLLSWALLSSRLLHGSQALTTHSGSTSVGAPQRGISSGTLLCSFSDDNNTLQMPVQPSLAWSVTGQIAATYNNLKTFTAQGCAQTFASSTQDGQAIWSPGGTHLLVTNSTPTQAQVLDARTKSVVASFPPAQESSEYTYVNPSVWSANGAQVISAAAGGVGKTSATVSVVIWDASNGAVIRTPLKFTKIQLGVQFFSLSPNGKYFALQRTDNSIEIWNVSSEKRVSTIAFGQSSASALEWSPDGASLALGLPNASEVQIWSTATGQLTASFTDHDASLQIVGALAWSHNGKYLAESGSDIHIWDVKARKFVATFGRVDTTQWIATLAWEPNSRMLVSSTNGVINKGKITENRVNVWKLA